MFTSNAIALETTVTNSKIQQSLFKYKFALLHFAMDDPVLSS